MAACQFYHADTERRSFAGPDYSLLLTFEWQRDYKE